VTTHTTGFPAPISILYLILLVGARENPNMLPFEKTVKSKNTVNSGGSIFMCRKSKISGEEKLRVVDANFTSGAPLARGNSPTVSEIQSHCHGG
jgi:hypothetical protein